MPIQPTLELHNISDAEFSEIDSVVMGCAFATQNHFGRLFDERVYENDLASRLRAEGLSVHTQVPVTLAHCGFEKTYYLDLVVNHMLYELKAVGALTGEHHAQALNYAMLQDIRLVKLINFGEAKVRGRLLRNALSKEERYQTTMNLADWRIVGSHCGGLINQMQSLIEDWGTHLDFRLYRDALVSFYGGEANCFQRVELLSGTELLGTHSVQQHDANLAFAITAFNKSQDAYRQHLKVLLEHVPVLRGIQWLNMNHSCLEAFTIERDIDSRMGTNRMKYLRPS